MTSKENSTKPRLGTKSLSIDAVWDTRFREFEGGFGFSEKLASRKNQRHTEDSLNLVSQTASMDKLFVPSLGFVEFSLDVNSKIAS